MTVSSLRVEHLVNTWTDQEFYREEWILSCILNIINGSSQMRREGKCGTTEIFKLSLS